VVVATADVVTPSGGGAGVVVATVVGDRVDVVVPPAVSPSPHAAAANKMHNATQSERISHLQIRCFHRLTGRSGCIGVSSSEALTDRLRRPVEATATRFHTEVLDFGGVKLRGFAGIVHCR
jgi:hypothetical protein